MIPERAMLSFYHCTELDRDQFPVRGAPLTCKFLHHHFNIIVGTIEEFLHERFARMRERPMADIMEKCRGDYQGMLISVSPNLREATSARNMVPSECSNRVWLAPG